MCNINDIEDEMHMLCTCTLYQHIQNEMYNNVIHKTVNVHHLNAAEKLFTLLVLNGKK